jgi:hypothetical protein
VTYCVTITHLKLIDYEMEMEDSYRGYLTQFIESNWFYILYTPILTFILIASIGRYVLSGILYPYQNAFARESLDRTNATKFGEEFAHYLDSFVYTLRVQAGQDIRRTILQSLANTSKNRGASEGTFTESEFPYDYLSFAEMRNVIDLLVLYISVN